MLQGVAATQSADPRDLAKQLSNPVASLNSVPFQHNCDEGLGALDQGSKSTLNIQPVVPSRRNDDWNLISRSIVPCINQTGVTSPDQSQSDFGDVVQSFFYSSKASACGRSIWGAGQVA